eukprot:4843372-Amphidinium_carterae.1
MRCPPGCPPGLRRICQIRSSNSNGICADRLDGCLDWVPLIATVGIPSGARKAHEHKLLDKPLQTTK